MNPKRLLAGLAMVVLLTSGVSGIELNSSEALKYYGQGTQDFRVSPGGNALIDDGTLNITNDGEAVANFSGTGIDLYKPLSVRSSGPLSVANGIELTGTSSNTIESLSTFYLSTSSGSASDIVLDPTGQVGVDSNLETAGNISVGGNQLDLEDGDIENAGDIQTGSVSDSDADNEIDFNSNRLTGLKDPNNEQDAATQSYVNSNDDTIEDNQGLEEVLSLDNKVGGENINFNETSNIQASGTNAITLDNQQNIGIPNGNLTLGDNSNITNFFNQDKCGPNQAIKTVYPNGSYVCNSISTTTEAENLSETLSAGNEAGDNNINLSGNNITDARKIEFQDAGGDILNVDQLSLSQGSSDYKLRVGGQKFLDEGFEDDSISPFSNDGDDVDWGATSNTPFGDHAAKATDTGNLEVAEMETTVSGGTLVVFKYYLDSGTSSYDEAFVETEDGKRKKLAGNGGEWKTGSLEVSPGSQIEFVLRGGTAGSTFNTDFRVDNVRVFNTTRNAVTVYGSQSLNTGDLNQVNRINFVGGLEAGQGSNASSIDAVAVGTSSTASAGSAVALGDSSSASGGGALAFGSFSSASRREAVAIGRLSEASRREAVAIGRFSEASDLDAVALGDGSTASDRNAVALGRESTASADDAVAIGSNADAPNPDEATFGNLNGQELDVNVTGNLTVHQNTDLNGNLNLNANQINNIGGLQNCGSDEFINGNGDCTADSFESNTNTQNPINADLVAGNGLTGGSNNVLPGSDSDVTLSLSANDLNSTGNLGTDVVGDNEIDNDDKFDLSNTFTVNSQLTADKAAFGVSQSQGGTELQDSTVYVGGNLDVEDDIRGSGGDLAEKVNSSKELEQGEVAVIAGNMSLEESTEAYDTAVAGVISTDPGIVLAKNRDGKNLGLSGIVPVEVTTSNGEIESGDLLTTSNKAGRAMKCRDNDRCENAVIGKAMQSTDTDDKIRVLLTMG